MSGEDKGGIHAMAYSRDRAEEVWTCTMAWPLKRLDLPLELSFGDASDYSIHGTKQQYHRTNERLGGA